MIRRIAPYCLTALGLYMAYRACKVQSPDPHRDDCLGREFEDHAEMAVAIVTGCPRGLPRDGERLTQRERQALRGIEAASSGRQMRRP